MKKLLSVRGFAPLGHNDGPDKGLDLEVASGECVLLSGPSGSGKTTLLLAAAGLLESGRATGERQAFQGGVPGRIGITLQNPESQILCATALEEAAFGLENAGMDRDQARKQALNALKRVGLAHAAQRGVEDLSMGQKQRLVMASALAMEARLLLLDEPFTQLDDTGREMLGRIIAEETAKGAGVLVCEHDCARLDGIAMRRVEIPGQEASLPDNGANFIFPARGRRLAPDDNEPRIDVSDLGYAPPDGPDILSGVSLTVGPGERVLIRGDNGCGKSTLLKCLAGAVSASRGSVRVMGLSAPRPWQLAGLVGYLGQDPEVQIFEETTLDEVAFPLTRTGFSKAEARTRAGELLTALGLGELAGHSPFTLSFGQKHMVALASVLAPGPGLLLLDEPYAGLSATMRRTLLDILDYYVSSMGAAVVMVSHDDRSRHWAGRVLNMAEGKLS